MQRSLVVRVVALVTLVGCGGGTTDPVGGNPSLINFTARIDGVQWQATGASTVQNPSPGLYSITGIRTGTNPYTMVLSLYNIKGPGTYALGVGPQFLGVPASYR